MSDQLEVMICAAHDLYDGYSIFEVMDLDGRNAALEMMVELYGPPEMEKIERYFVILDQIRHWNG